MKNYIALGGCFLLIILTLSSFEPARKTNIYTSNYENVLGTSLEIKIQSINNQIAENSEKAALIEIDRLNKILSSYDQTSEFKLFEQTFKTPVNISTELFEVLELFNKWQTTTNGALNPAAETISKIWKVASISNQLPQTSELKEAVKKVNALHWSLNKNNQSAIHLTSTHIGLNSFVKSYIINKAAQAALKVEGVDGVIINIGGDIVVRGNMNELIGISNPFADAENDDALTVLRIKDKAIATSGNYRRGFKIKNTWYSHIIDPRTAQPSSSIASATVIADDATTAGALATAFNVLDVNESMALAKNFPNVEYLIVDKFGKYSFSNGWKDLEMNKLEISKSGMERELNNSNFETIINFELALIKAQRVYRPFVAVWVEDEDKKPVKNIAVWYNKDKWLADLKNWYRAYGAEYKLPGGPVQSTTSATRAPGKYTLKWDGTDDQKKPVKNGTYTINIEVVREHGTYQIISKKITLNNKPQTFTFSPNEEVASASIEYRKKTK